MDSVQAQIAAAEARLSLARANAVRADRLFRAQHNVSKAAPLINFCHVFNDIQVLVHLMHYRECSTNLGIDQMIQATPSISKWAHSHN